MAKPSAIVVGAGIGGLAAAADLACCEFDVQVLDQAPASGGKLIPVRIGEHLLDAGPTVFTMKWVFQALFDDAGAAFDEAVPNHRLELLARHAWSEETRLDLYADRARSADAIGRFAGPAEARGFLSFCERAHQIYRTLEGPFIRSQQPTPVSLARGAGLSGLGDLWRISPFTTLWRALGEHFADPRLRQLFGRYATYNGSSPFLSPATLMLIADVEQQGVWSIEGGMHRLARAIETLAAQSGARFRYQAHVLEIIVERGRATGVRLLDGEELMADAIIFNGDAAALGAGLLGASARKAASVVTPADRSLSAVTWLTLAETHGFPLARHNVFFSRDYKHEFQTILGRRQLPDDPTVYICAQDCDADCFTSANKDAHTTHKTPERFLCLINAPPDGDRRRFGPEEIERCQANMIETLRRAGMTLKMRPERTVVRTPHDFAQAYPATGGALYGQASHGWRASFSRPAAATRIPGLYLAGGSVHPGAGVPMAAMSGRIAAQRLIADRTSRHR